ncbi:MAG: CBU_2076 family Dot/Icm type IV secretion system effector [Bdellovibrio sp.]
MFQIVVFVDIDHVDQVKDALFSAGAGRLGHYECCSFETRGTGQFRPIEGADPFIGKVGEIERVDEIRVEMMCTREHLKAAIEAMLEAHPYETPAYYVCEHYDWKKI